MKQIGSVCMAAAKNLWWKLLVILILLTAGELFLYCRFVDHYYSYVWDSFQRIVRDTKLYLVFFAALIALTACCCLQGCRFAGKNDYLLRRLPLAEWRITILWAVVHLFCFVILWAWQLMTVFLLWKCYAAASSPASPGLELLVAFYDNGFLHGLLPLKDTARWLLLLGYWPTMAWLTASFGFFQRRGSFRIGLLFLLGIYFVLMQELGNAAACGLFFAGLLLVLAGNIYGMWGACHETNPN